MDQILSPLQAKSLAENKPQNSKNSQFISEQGERKGWCHIFTLLHPYFPSSSHRGFKLCQAIAVYRPNLVYELTLKASPSDKAYQPLKQNKPAFT